MKKNILIPYEKYEKLVAKSNADAPDGQCVSHTHHIESNRDKLNEYGVRVERDTDDKQNPNLSFDVHKGKGGFDVSASARTSEGGLSPVGSRSPSPKRGKAPPSDAYKLSPAEGDLPPIRPSPIGRGSYRRHVGPPGRRERTKQKGQRKKHWQHF